MQSQKKFYYQQILDKTFVNDVICTICKNNLYNICNNGHAKRLDLEEQLRVQDLEDIKEFPELETKDIGTQTASQNTAKFNLQIESGLEFCIPLIGSQMSSRSTQNLENLTLSRVVKVESGGMGGDSNSLNNISEKILLLGRKGFEIESVNQDMYKPLKVDLFKGFLYFNLETGRFRSEIVKLKKENAFKLKKIEKLRQKGIEQRIQIKKLQKRNSKISVKAEELKLELKALEENSTRILRENLTLIKLKNVQAKKIGFLESSFMGSGLGKKKREQSVQTDIRVGDPPQPKIKKIYIRKDSQSSKQVGLVSETNYSSLPINMRKKRSSFLKFRKGGPKGIYAFLFI